MDSTVAVALIAVGGTVASAGLSYFGSRLTTRAQLEASEKNIAAQLRTAEQSAETQLQSILVDVKRLDDTQAQELRSSRQRLYQDYLSAAYALRDFYAGTSPASDADALKSASNEFLRREIEIELLASERVKELAEDLYDLLTGALDKAIESSKFTDSADAVDLLARVYEKKRWRPARDALVNAMREELTPSEN
jgi:phosphoglucomutase